MSEQDVTIEISGVHLLSHQGEIEVRVCIDDRKWMTAMRADIADLLDGVDYFAAGDTMREHVEAIRNAVREERIHEPTTTE